MNYIDIRFNEFSPQKRYVVKNCSDSSDFANSKFLMEKHRRISGKRVCANLDDYSSIYGLADDNTGRTFNVFIDKCRSSYKCKTDEEISEWLQTKRFKFNIISNKIDLQKNSTFPFEEITADQ